MEAKLVRFASVGVFFALFAVMFAAVPMTSRAGDVGTRADELILTVGGQDEMKTRNLLPAIANDVWTSDVIFRVYDTVLQSHPTTKELVAYIIKGVDADSDGIFQRDEYGKFLKENVTAAGAPCTVANGCALQVTAFYDFNGIWFHDGVQADIWDLIFTYHLFGLNARFNTDLRVIMDPDFTSNRRMNMAIAALDSSNWQDSVPTGASGNLRASLTFTMNEPFALFYESTLAGTLLPEHIWEGNGGGRHADFGCLIYPPGDANQGKGIGLADPLPSGCASTYDYSNGAEKWAVTDADLVGTGPFKFVTWIGGQFAKVERYDNFYIGDNPLVAGQVFDPQLHSYIKAPTITGILFRIYRSTTLGVLALKQNEIDFYHWNIPAEFVPDLLNEPSVQVEANPEPGFFYMAYNMRRDPWGYDAAGTDVGYEYRQAVSHLVDKRGIVQNLLQNFGTIGHGVVSPANTFWSNPNLPKPSYDPVLADAILDAAYGAWSPVTGLPCNGDNLNVNPLACRPLRGRGTLQFAILTPQADYDPVRAAAGQMIADAMRGVGINVISKPLAFGEIVAQLDARNFDQYILGWRIGGTDPDYMFSFWDSSNSAAGQNYPGYNNATFDTLIRASRAELDRNQRQTYIWEAQANLADSRPYEVLYYRTNIEGYRKDRFINWTVSSGSIWNYYSLLGISRPSSKALSATPSLPSAVSTQTGAVTISVFDQDRNPLAGANVSLEIKTPNGGNLTGNSMTGTMIYGPSGANGQFPATYIPPVLPVGAAPLTVLIGITVSHPDFDFPSTKTTQIIVFGPTAQFLAITVDLPTGDIASPGGTLLMEVRVTDQNGDPVSGADVQITSGNTAVATALPASGITASDGRIATVTLTARGTVSANTAISVSATKALYFDGDANFQMAVVAITNGPCPAQQVRNSSGVCVPETVTTPGLEAIVLIALVGALGAVAVVRSRRRDH